MARLPRLLKTLLVETLWGERTWMSQPLGLLIGSEVGFGPGAFHHRSLISRLVDGGVSLAFYVRVENWARVPRGQGPTASLPMVLGV